MLFDRGLMKFYHKAIITGNNVKLFGLDVFKYTNGVKYLFAVALDESYEEGTVMFLYQLPNGNLQDELRFADDLLDYEVRVNFFNWFDLMISQVAIKGGCTDLEAKRVQDTVFRLKFLRDTLNK